MKTKSLILTRLITCTKRSVFFASWLLARLSFKPTSSGSPEPYANWIVQAAGRRVLLDNADWTKIFIANGLRRGGPLTLALCFLCIGLLYLHCSWPLSLHAPYSSHARSVSNKAPEIYFFQKYHEILLFFYASSGMNIGKFRRKKNRERDKISTQPWKARPSGSVYFSSVKNQSQNRKWVQIGDTPDNLVTSQRIQWEG